MCCHLGLVARGVGADFVEATILPQLVDLVSILSVIQRIRTVQRLRLNLSKIIEMIILGHFKPLMK